MRSYEIKLTSPGFDTAVASLNRVGLVINRIDQKLTSLASKADGIDRLASRFERLADAVERVSSASGSVAAAPRASSGGGGGGSRAARFVRGPYQALAAAYQSRTQAMDEGNPLAVNDANYAIRLKERAIALDQRRKNDPEHLTRPGLLELFSQMNSLLGKLKRGDLGGALISLGRNTGGGLNIQQMQSFGIGSLGNAAGGAAESGLMARIAPMAGRAMSSAAGPYAAAIIGPALMAATSIRLLGNAASASASAFGPLMGGAAAGGTMGDAAALRVMGLSPSEAASLGASLRSKLSSDPFAISAGGYQLPAHLSGGSDLKLVSDKLDQLHALYIRGDLREMTRQARVFGMEGQLQRVMVSDSVYQSMQHDAQTGRRVLMAPRFQRIYTEAQSQEERLGANIQKFVGIAGSGAVWLKSEFDRMAADAVDKATGLLTRGKDGQAKSQQEQNTDAVRELTKALKETIGGGPRARGALSPAIRAAMSRGAKWDAARDLRAFRL